MANGQLDTVLQQIRKLVTAPATGKLSDGELLERFVVQQDGAAFAALVERYGGLVLGVCRRVLHRVHDAEDACQAAFLVLARRAASIRKKDAIGSWLHGVAYRVAQRLKRDIARHRAREGPVVDVPQMDNTADVTWREVRAVLDEELRRLPEKYQAAVVLCYLQGKTRDEAAQQLGWSAGTLRGRLNRGRELLRARLTRRGLTLSAALLASALAQDAASAAVPATQVVLMIKTASLIAAGRTAAAAVVSARVATLMEGVLRTMYMTKLKVAAAVLLIVGVLGGGAGTLAYRTVAAQEGELKQANQNQPAATGIGDAKPASGAQQRGTLHGPAGVLSVAFSPDGKLLAAGHADGSVTFWDVRTGKKVASTGGSDDGWNSHALRSVQFSPDGKVLATGSADKAVRLWDVETRRELAAMNGHTEPVHGVAFSPDGRSLASAGGDETVRLWDVATGRERIAIRVAGSVAFAPDGKSLATAVEDGTVRLWDAASGKELRKVGPPRGAKDTWTTGRPAVAFSPDGKVLASTVNEKSVSLWDPATGKELRRFAGTAGAVNSVAFAPDGRLLAVGGSDKTVRLFDIATGKEVATLKGHQDAVSSVAFSPDGRVLASGSPDGTVRLWDWKNGRAVRQIGAAAAGAGGDRLERLVQNLVKSKRTDEEAVEALFLATLGRFPTETEQKFTAGHLAKKDRKEALEDVLFTLVNTKEFAAHVESLRQRQPRLPH